MFYDIEGREIVTTEQLREEWLFMMREGMIDEMTFPEFLRNSLASNGGTLKEV